MRIRVVVVQVYESNVFRHVWKLRNGCQSLNSSVIDASNDVVSEVYDRQKGGGRTVWAARGVRKETEAKGSDGSYVCVEQVLVIYGKLWSCELKEHEVWRSRVWLPLSSQETRVLHAKRPLPISPTDP